MSSTKTQWSMPWQMVSVLAFAIGVAAGTWFGVLTTIDSFEKARARYQGPEVSCPALPPTLPHGQ